MKKAKEYADELAKAFDKSVRTGNNEYITKMLADVLYRVTRTEVFELKELRKISTDQGLVPIFKEQRKKYAAICRRFNKYGNGMLSVADFDAAIKMSYKAIYHWYETEVLNATPVK